MHKLIEIKVFEDSRGRLKKVFTKSLLEKYNFGTAKESYVISFNAGEIVRGEHFHLQTNEVFSVVKGKCRFEIVENDKTVIIDIGEDEKIALLVMKNTAHRIISLVGDSIVVAVSSKEYFEDDTDTFDYVF